MGLFCPPPKSIEDSTALELVETAEANIKLWKTHQASTHLLTDFAVSLLNLAAKKLNTNETTISKRAL